jgi:hypothetical protein
MCRRYDQRHDLRPNGVLPPFAPRKRQLSKLPDDRIECRVQFDTTPESRLLFPIDRARLGSACSYCHDRGGEDRYGRGGDLARQPPETNIAVHIFDELRAHH